MTLLGFVRIATHPRIFPEPLDVEDALGRVDAWLANPVTRLVEETEAHWRTLRPLLEHAGTAGNLTSDAHLAALAITHGATVVSADTDFSSIRGLRWENPLDSR